MRTLVALFVLAGSLSFWLSPLKAADPAPSGETWTLTGKCVDLSDQPLGAVELELFRFEAPTGDPVSIAASTTGPDGAYRFESLDRGTASKELVYCLTARLPGYASQMEMFNVRLGRIPESIKMTSQIGTLSGRITDEGGRSVAHALIAGRTFGGTPVLHIACAESDADGRYTIADMPAFKGMPGTRINFWIKHPDFASASASYSGIPETVDVTLLKGALIEGTVADAVTGQPAGSAEVYVQGVRERGFARARTDTDGRYRLRLTPDAYNIRAIATDRTCVALDSFDAKNNETYRNVNLELIDGGFITGKITDSKSGKPLSKLGDWKITIGHHGPAFPKSGAAVGVAQVEEDGTYRLRVAPGDNYPYIMKDVSTQRSPRSVYKHPPIQVKPGQSVEFNMTIVTGM